MLAHAEIFEKYEHLKGRLITPDGWDGIQTFVYEQPSHQPIDDCFTEELEEAVLSSDRMSHHEDVTSVGAFFLELSATTKDNSGAPIVDIDRTSESLYMHIDTQSGHTFLGNFAVEKASHYTVLAHPSEQEYFYEDLSGEQYRIYIDPAKPEEIAIASRQLVIINGSFVEAVNVTDPTETTPILTSVPHEAYTVPDGSRVLLNVYSQGN